MVRDVLANADIVLWTDGGGSVVSSEGNDDTVEVAELAEDLDLALATLEQLGRRHDAGGLDVALLMFAGRLVAIAEAGDRGHVAIVAGPTAQPGLLLRDVRRLVTAYAVSTGGEG